MCDTWDQKVFLLETIVRVGSAKTKPKTLRDFD